MKFIIFFILFFVLFVVAGFSLMGGGQSFFSWVAEMAGPMALGALICALGALSILKKMQDD